MGTAPMPPPNALLSRCLSGSSRAAALWYSSSLWSASALPAGKARKQPCRSGAWGLQHQCPACRGHSGSPDGAQLTCSRTVADYAARDTVGPCMGSRHAAGPCAWLQEGQHAVGLRVLCRGRCGAPEEEAQAAQGAPIPRCLSQGSIPACLAQGRQPCAGCSPKETAH